MRTITMALAALLALGMLAIPAAAQEGGSPIDDAGGGVIERPAVPADPADPGDEGDEAADESVVIAGGDTTEVAGVTLARTGIELSAAALLAIVLLLGGAVVLLASRRKASSIE